ncbi:hypothetical protein PINS_up000144 [Pythium insidiosum]|nr:hypothetical protein PINS_up000144 [Pythium insidiosum]
MFRSEFMTPYLTCSRCNNVTFINILRVRRRDAPRDPATLHQYEQLPVCSGCGTTKYLRAGVTSFHEKIAEEQQAIKEFERKRGPATALLQRIARGFLGRLEFRRRKRERELYILRINRAATLLQARVRGMQARRRTVIERCLRLIRSMHPRILRYALTSRPDRPPVFWYESPSELQILFWNYREFVRRSGGKPPLIKVESNILEITRRMLLREYVLVSRVQARWRGLTTRFVFLALKRQRGWLRGLQQSPAIKIQRVFRAHSAKRRVAAIRAVKPYPDRLAAYRAERAADANAAKARAFRERLLAKYRLGYQVHRTGRMLALQVREDSVSKKNEAADDRSHSLRSPEQRNGDETPQKPTPTAAAAEEEERKRSLPASARKFSQLKQHIDNKHARRLRGPRAHIANAHKYLVPADTDDMER